MGLTKYKLGELIYEINNRNTDLKYSIQYVRGISNSKEIMPTKADVEPNVISKFYVINPEEFIYNPRTTRMGEKVGLAYNNSNSPLLFTFNNIAFAVKDSAKDKLAAQYLYIYFNRSEFDRYAIINSWGSATELFTFEDMCDIEIDLPPLPVQQKYVAVYRAMCANQQSYECGLEDLKLSIDAVIEQFKHTAPRKPLGELIDEVDNRNTNESIGFVNGVNKEKQFISSVASGADLTKYKIVRTNQLACNLMHVGRDVAVPVALNTLEEPLLVSPAYLVFETKSDEVLPEFLLAWLSRTETDRYAWFMSDTNVRSGMEKRRFYELEIPTPSITVQRALVELHRVYAIRRAINAQLKEQIKSICPILVRGACMEAHS